MKYSPNEQKKLTAKLLNSINYMNADEISAKTVRLLSCIEVDSQMLQTHYNGFKPIIDRIIGIERNFNKLCRRLTQQNQAVNQFKEALKDFKRTFNRLSTALCNLETWADESHKDLSNFAESQQALWDAIENNYSNYYDTIRIVMCTKPDGTADDSGKLLLEIPEKHLDEIVDRIKDLAPDMVIYGGVKDN